MTLVNYYNQHEEGYCRSRVIIFQLWNRQLASTIPALITVADTYRLCSEFAQYIVANPYYSKVWGTSLLFFCRLYFREFLYTSD